MSRGAVWWALWLLYAGAWSTALLATFPLAVRDAFVPEEYGFSVGKLLHVTAYAVFAVLTSRLPALRRLVLLLVILHAPLTEFLQGYTGRTPSLYDVALDWTGVTLGALVTWNRWRSTPS